MTSRDAESQESPAFPGKVVLVGARGRMGQLLLEKARKCGIQTETLDKPLLPEKIRESLKNAKLVILCVPARAVAEVLDKITPYLEKDAILSDIISVKEKPMRQMEKKWPGAVVGTHPLFGPRPDPDMRLPVAIVQGRNSTREDYKLVRDFFEILGCRTFPSTAAEHDQAMSKIQNMNFITNLAYFAALAQQEDLRPYLTPSFERRKNAARKMLTEDAEMFAGLFEANPYSHEAVRQFRKMLNIAASGDIDLLCKKAIWWWPECQGQKPENTNKKGA